MITRQQAENQAERCFGYHAALYLGAITALAAFGSNGRMFKAVAGGWGLGVLAHAVLLHAVPQAREQILMQTASLMEDWRRADAEKMAEQTA